MNEPIYEFVKGQGWVIAPQNIIVIGCGTRVRVEFRTPNEGELCYAYSPTSRFDRWSVEDKLTSLKDVRIEWLHKFYIGHYSTLYAVLTPV